MTLIVENGSGLADAESYISVADADTYFANRGYTLWDTMTEAEKEQALRRATDFTLQLYRLKWKGTRVTGTQALDWPRNWVIRDDYEFATLNGAQVIGGRQYYPADIVPVEVQRACAELAFRGASGELAPDIGQRTVREKVDVIEVEYDRYSPQFTQFRAIDNLLAPFLKDTGGAVRRVVRA
jgi:hypothetical protein